MLEMISAEIIYCRERARQARKKADTATANEKRSHLDAEGRWLALARSHELQQRLSTTLGGSGRIFLMEGMRSYAFKPEVATTIGDVFHRVVVELGLSDLDEVIALKAARLIIGLPLKANATPSG